jgi:hypothetical protein
MYRNKDRVYWVIRKVNILFEITKKTKPKAKKHIDDQKVFQKNKIPIHRQRGLYNYWESLCYYCFSLSHSVSQSMRVLFFGSFFLNFWLLGLFISRGDTTFWIHFSVVIFYQNCLFGKKRRERDMTHHPSSTIEAHVDSILNSTRSYSQLPRVRTDLVELFRKYHSLYLRSGPFGTGQKSSLFRSVFGFFSQECRSATFVSCCNIWSKNNTHTKLTVFFFLDTYTIFKITAKGTITVNLVYLTGTIPTLYKRDNNVYNIPVTIYLTENYPFEPPVVFVTPTASTNRLTNTTNYQHTEHTHILLMSLFYFCSFD